MWTYRISTGIMGENGQMRPEVCYSGLAEAKNNPAMVSVPNAGATPPGKYRIGKGYDDPGGLGVLVMALEPLPGTDTFGRDAFRIHGDSASHPGAASHGCIIAPHSLRLSINASQDRILEVMA